MTEGPNVGASETSGREPLDRAELPAQRFVEAIAMASPSWIYVFELDSATVSYMNRSVLRDLGYPPETKEATRLDDIRQYLSPEDVARLPQLLEAWRTLADHEVREDEIRVRHADGTYRWCLGRETVFSRHPDGRVREILGTLADVTPLTRAMDRLRESEERFRTLIEDLDVGVLVQNAADDRILLSNRAAEEMLGLGRAELGGLSSHTWPFRLVHEDGSDYPRDRLPSVVAARTGRAVRNEIVGSLDTRTGACRWLQVTAMPRRREEEGSAGNVLVTMTDVTSRKTAEEALRQSQKMQAIGQLAGGVAHDFNNLLTVIISCSDMALQQLETDPESARECIRSIRETSDQAAMLTRQLLSFGRKGTWNASLIDVNEIVAHAGQMLRRIIGEDIAIETLLSPHVATTRCDAAQLEQVVVNLALNARDAMPNGGRLVIRTSDVVFGAAECHIDAALRPGRFVRLSITDTGRGIAPEVRAHLFEPFFTTKAPGKGTGLGLSTVYGIVQQAGGFITVDSTVGAGTTFDVFLPAVDDEVGAARDDVAEHGATGSETVLVVEDQADVRHVMVKALRAAGFHVLDVGSAAEAVEVVARPAPSIRLLIADVVMPGMGGRALAERARAARPGLAVLLISGYSPDAAIREGLALAGEPILEKPFTPNALTRTVREVLDARR